MSRVLLLGRDGQLGWELARALATLGETLALGSRELDLERADDVRRAVRAARPDVVVNAAAYTAVDRAEQEPDRAAAVNALAPGVLAEEAAAGGGALVHYSTDYVFDGAKRAPYTEEDATNPLNSYGRSKLEGERAVEAVGGAYVILRTSWVYGLRRESFVTKVLGWARTQRALRVVADQVGSPTWCRSLAEATAALLARAPADPAGYLRERAGVYHLAGTGAVSRYDWARAILALDPRREEQAVEELLPASSEDFPTPALRPAYSALDSGRAREALGVALPDWSSDLARSLRERGRAAEAGAAASTVAPATAAADERNGPRPAPAARAARGSA